MALEQQLLRNLSTMEKYGNPYGKKLASVLRAKFDKAKSEFEEFGRPGTNYEQVLMNVTKDVEKESADYLKSIGDRLDVKVMPDVQGRSGLLSRTNLMEGLTKESLQSETKNLLQTGLKPTFDIQSENLDQLFSYIQSRREFLRGREQRPGLRAQTLLTGQGGLLT